MFLKSRTLPSRPVKPERDSSQETDAREGGGQVGRQYSQEWGPHGEQRKRVYTNDPRYRELIEEGWVVRHIGDDIVPGLRIATLVRP